MGPNNGAQAGGFFRSDSAQRIQDINVPQLGQSTRAQVTSNSSPKPKLTSGAHIVSNQGGQTSRVALKEGTQVDPRSTVQANTATDKLRRGLLAALGFFGSASAMLLVLKAIAVVLSVAFAISPVGWIVLGSIAGVTAVALISAAIYAGVTNKTESLKSLAWGGAVPLSLILAVVAIVPATIGAIGFISQGNS